MEETLEAAADSLAATSGLTDNQKQFYQTAKDFADKEMLPHAEKWDDKEIFPVDVLKELAKLGFGAVYVRDDVGGTGLR
jgi:alkylation response protein AidB-like acyl-CoA dehydrogenase